VLADVPETVWSSLPAMCLFRTMLGLECFGCGMTRALSSAVHGHFAAAIQYYCGVVLMAPALLGGAVQALLIRR
jgi:hypothetical protein